MDDLDHRRAEDARHRENRARLAHVNARFVQTGEGSIEFEDVVEFGLTYVDRPFVQTGHQLTDIEQLADDDDNPALLPQVTSFVVEWERDDRGFYVGAWCAGVVTYPPDSPDVTEVEIEHMFTFSAIAIKDVPLDVTD